MLSPLGDCRRWYRLAAGFFSLLGSNVQALPNVDYSWDAENRLSGIQPAGTPADGDLKLGFAYDYMGRRVRKQVQTWDATPAAWVLTLDRKFVWNGWLLLLELDGLNGDAVVRKYTWGSDLSNSLAGAGGIGDLLAAQDVEANPDVDYLYFYDRMGNVGQVVNTAFDPATDQMDAHYEYNPYGGVVLSAGSYASTNAFRFSTKYFDDETGLGYWGYRYYNPAEGRWLNRDPIEEAGGINLNRAMLNRPVGIIDALGLQAYKAPPVTLCGAFIVCPRNDIVVPEGALKKRDILLKAGLDPDNLIGFEVIFLPKIPSRLGQFKGPSPNPGDCSCQCQKRSNIRLVQVIRWAGTIARQRAKVDGQEEGQTVPPGMKPPGRTGDGTSFEDGPYNPKAGANQATAYIEICAFCTVKGKEKNLGCFRMTWTRGTRAKDWKDRKFKIETQGFIPALLTGGEYKGCHLVSPDSPGALFKKGLKEFPP